MSTNGNGNGRFVEGLFLGVALGAMGAALLTPKSGKRLRRDIAREGRRMKRRGEDFKERAEDAVGELVEQGSDALEAARDTVAEAKHVVHKAARSARG